MGTVLVAGDVMIDRTIHCEVKGPSPENENILVVRSKKSEFNLGGAGNVAANLKAMGAEPIVFTSLGLMYDTVVATLFQDSHIQYHAVMRPMAELTPVKTRIVTPAGQLLRVDDETPEHQCKQPDNSDQLLTTFTKYLQKKPVPVVCLVDYNKGVLAEPFLTKLVERAKNADTWIFVDPGRRDFWFKYGSPRTVFKANIRQCMTLLREHHRDTRNCFMSSHEMLGVNYWERSAPLTPHEAGTAEMYQDFAREVRYALDHGAALDYAALWITLGAGGSVFIRPQPFPGCAEKNKPSPLYVPADKPHSVVDVCGAGDTALAAFVAHVADHGFTPSNAAHVRGLLRSASAAARVAVEHRGVRVVHKEEYRRDG